MRFLLRFLCRYIDGSDNHLDLAICTPTANAEMAPEAHSIAPRARGFIFKVCLNVPTESRMINQCPRIKGITPAPAHNAVAECSAKD
jgi:hypothetical protein